MEPVFNKGQLTKWKDDRGFGFIKPDDGGREVFLHISVLKGAGRRPKVGDMILYKQVAEADGKIRAVRASIQGVSSQPLSKQQKAKQRSLLKAGMGIVLAGSIGLFTLEFSPGRSPDPITLITKPECAIKGNVSIETSRKLYHLPGMEDYESTVIDPAHGEKWFCTESEAISQGWRKAPR